MSCDVLVRCIFLHYLRIIAIAGIGTPPPERWDDDAKSSWLACIPPTAAPKKAILKWDHGLDVDNFSWQRLVEQGRDLLKALINLHSPESGSQVCMQGVNII